MARFLKRFFHGFKKESSLVGNIGQWLGVLLLCVGFFAFAYKGTSRLETLVTAGAVIFTMATKVKHEWR